MDSGSVTASGRLKNKRSKKQKSKEDHDIISNLPDFIIGRILSFLPTKDAVCTSVLSKRWMYLWTFMTDLHFQDREPWSYKKNKKRCFIKFVNRVLHHLNSSSIQSFSLTISEMYDPSHIDEWIFNVLERGVKKLCVDLKKELARPSYSIVRNQRVRNPYVNSKKELTLSSSTLLKCQSLEEWVLRVDCCVIRVPAFVHLSSLTVLKLSGVKFILDYYIKSENIHLNFPVLRIYETKNCTWSHVKGVTLEVPLLEMVSIDYRPPSLSDDSHAAIKFCASHLAEFNYNGYMLPDTIVLDLSAAHIASANIVPCKYEGESVQETGILACKLLKQFNGNVERLKFQRSEVLAQAKDSLVDLPAFEMLSHLELGKISGEILLALLLKTPVLKTLILKELLEYDKELLNSAIVPHCFSSTLKVVKFGSLNGHEYELSFAKFVMENALVLERMSFFPTWRLLHSDLENLEEVKEKLFSCKKGFRFAILEFSSF